MDKKWNERTMAEKIASVISIVALCVWLLFEVLERTTSLGFAKYVNYIAVCVICVCETFTFWNIKRYISYIAIGGMLCMLAVLILEAM